MTRIAGEGCKVSLGLRVMWKRSERLIRGVAVLAVMLAALHVSHPIYLLPALPFLMFSSAPALLGILTVLVLTPSMPFSQVPMLVQAYSLVLLGYMALLARFNGLLTEKTSEQPSPALTVRRWGHVYAFTMGAALAAGALLLREAPVLLLLGWSGSLLLLAFQMGGLPQFRGRDVLRKGFATVWVLGLTFLFMEAGARYLLPPPAGLPSLWTTDPQNIYRFVPNYCHTHRFRAYEGVLGSFDICLNSRGLRTFEPTPKQPGEYRIAFVGDSYTFGWTVNPEDSFAMRVGAGLTPRSGGMEIVALNAGVGGYGPWQALGVLKEIFPLYHPDLVILQTFANNDIDDSLAQVGKRLRIFLRDHHLELERHRQKLTGGIFWFEELATQHLASYRYLCAKLRRPLLQRAHDRIRFFEPVVPAQAAGLAWIHEVDRVEWYPELEEGWALFQASIIEMRDYCSAVGVPFAAFNIPYPTDPAIFPHASIYDLDKGARLAEAFFRAKGIPHFNMLQTFRQHPHPERLYFHAEGHINEEGHALVAQALLEFLLNAFPEEAPWRPGARAEGS